jgi:hypothetical protein
MLTKMRSSLTEESRREKSMEAIQGISQVLQFLENAKSDEVFQAELSDILISASRRTGKRTKSEALEIPANLTDDQIKHLLERDLSKTELKQIAQQRSLSTGKRSIRDLRAAILSIIARQENYDRLKGS